MKSKLFLIYLRYKNPLLIIMGALAIISVSLNWWGNHNAKAVSGEWEVGEVISGARFRAKKENQTDLYKVKMKNVIGWMTRCIERTEINQVE